MITCSILPNGNLRIAAIKDTREYIAEHVARDWWGTLAELFESYSSNGSYTPFDAGEGNPYVGLTSAPCIAEAMAVEEDGTQKIDGKLWWFPDYMIRCPLDELAATGETTFCLVEGA